MFEVFISELCADSLFKPCSFSSIEEAGIVEVDHQIECLHLQTCLQFSRHSRRYEMVRLVDRYMFSFHVRWQ